VTRPAYDPDEAEENARAKAGPIALYAYRLGITYPELDALPYSSRDRSIPTRRRFATAALRASADPADHDRNPPHSDTADSWDHVRRELAALEDRERYGFDPPPRDLLHERARWLPRPVETVPLPEPGEPPDDMPADIPLADFDPEETAARLAEDDRLAERELPPPLRSEQLARTTPPARRARPLDLVAYDSPPALVTAGSPPLLPGEKILPGPPRGWHLLAALGPVQPERPCRWCGHPAIVGTLNGWRCWAHWPVRGDSRGDWGWNLNWAPNPGKPPCLPSVCYCGRCPHYDPGGNSARGVRAGQSAP
jgi:hypothetical protein